MLRLNISYLCLQLEFLPPQRIEKSVEKTANQDRDLFSPLIGELLCVKTKRTSSVGRSRGSVAQSSFQERGGLITLIFRPVSFPMLNRFANY